LILCLHVQDSLFVLSSSCKLQGLQDPPRDCRDRGVYAGPGSVQSIFSSPKPVLLAEQRAVFNRGRK
jgi:hypothetical protein